MKRCAYIYSGPGTSMKGLRQTEATLGHFFTTQNLTSDELINGEWEKEADLLILPGGADIPYTKSLNGAGNQKIRAYVEGGGALLGICAGSYFASNFVDFAKGTANEVQGARELAFFPGTVRGPMYGPYDFRSEKGARACTISWQERPVVVYYNGGGHFVDASSKDNTKILASYDSGEAAIIECLVGKGKALLSAVHFEYDEMLLDSSDGYLQEIIPALEANRDARIELVNHLLERLVKASHQ